MFERHHAAMAGVLAQIGVDCNLTGDEAPTVDEYSSFTTKEDVGEGIASLVPIRTA